MGDSEEAVAECMARLRALVDNARSHDAFTHFVSIPLAYENVKRNLKEFQCQALAVRTSSLLPKASLCFSVVLIKQ